MYRDTSNTLVFKIQSEYTSQLILGTPSSQHCLRQSPTVSRQMIFNFQRHIHTSTKSYFIHPISIIIHHDCQSSTTCSTFHPPKIDLLWGDISPCHQTRPALGNMSPRHQTIPVLENISSCRRIRLALGSTHRSRLPLGFIHRTRLSLGYMLKTTNQEDNFLQVRLGMTIFTNNLHVICVLTMDRVSVSSKSLVLETSKATNVRSTIQKPQKRCALLQITLQEWHILHQKLIIEEEFQITPTCIFNTIWNRGVVVVTSKIQH